MGVKKKKPLNFITFTINESPIPVLSKTIVTVKVSVCYFLTTVKMHTTYFVILQMFDDTWQSCITTDGNRYVWQNFSELGFSNHRLRCEGCYKENEIEKSFRIEKKNVSQEHRSFFNT
jgi:hypothetical protein